MASKVYAVKVGRIPGIYSTWAECEEQVKGFSGAEYKSFKNDDDANIYMDNVVHGTSDEMSTHSDVTPNHADIFVDGSYNSNTNEYGCGVYIKCGNKERIIVDKGLCQENGRNVEGEVAAATIAITSVLNSKNIDSIALYHDYQGVGSWADGDWKANKTYSKKYQSFVGRARNKGLKISFEHVDGHTGVLGNEYADKLAKMACDVPLTVAEEKFIGQLKHVPGYPSGNVGQGSAGICYDATLDDFEFC